MILLSITYKLTHEVQTLCLTQEGRKTMSTKSLSARDFQAGSHFWLDRICFALLSVHAKMYRINK